MLGCGNRGIEAAPEVPAHESLNKGIDRIDSFFSGKLVINQSPIFPQRLAGSILFYDLGNDSPSYTRLLPDENVPEPEVENTLVFQSLIDKGFAAKANYLGFVNAELTADDKAEVVVENIFRAAGRDFLSQQVQNALANALKKFARPNRRFMYVEAVRLVTIKYKKFVKFQGGGAASFFVNVAGNTYNSSSDFSLRTIVAVDAVPVEVGLMKDAAGLRAFGLEKRRREGVLVFKQAVEVK